MENDIKDAKSLHKKGRKWLLTINNPIDYNLDHDSIKLILEKLKLDYWCMCDEIGKNKTPHTHLFIHKQSTVRFNTIKKLFNSAHIDWCNGSCKENRDYIRKEGKYLTSDKKETNLIETFEEFGDLPNESNKKLEDKILLQKLIDEGYTNEEIIRQFPQFTYQIKKIDEIRYTLLFSTYKKINRDDLKVFYIYGETATGKSKFIHDNYDASDIYVVSDYLHPFDDYVGQRVIVFEEFRSSIKYSDMLQYLDIYPCQLGARYMNKWACYKVVFVISNIMLDEQYKNKFEDENSKKAFYRRFNGGIIEFIKYNNPPYKNYIYDKKYYLDLEDYSRGICSQDIPVIKIEDEEEEEDIEDESKME